MVTQLPASQAVPHYDIRLLGPFAVCRDGCTLDTGSWQRSVAALLKLLSTAPEWRRSRDEIIDILWPEATPEAAASNLRSQLHRLRRALGAGDPSPVLYDHTWLELNRAYTWEIDLDRFESRLRPADLAVEDIQAALALYRGEPLPDERYEDWAQPVRERVERLRRDSMMQVARVLGERGERQGECEHLERVLERDSLDEEALRRLLLALAGTGRRTEAVRRYRDFEQRLHDELGLEPDTATRSVVDGITTQEPASPRAEAAGAGHPAQVQPTVSLPPQLTSFVGREQEIAEIQASLVRPEVRLVTLTGSGGTGKTRLAIEAARGIQASFPDGVFFVSLAPLSESSLVIPTLAATIGVGETGTSSILDRLLEHLRSCDALLLIDNIEHLLEAAPDVGVLLNGCPRLHFLVTSRTPLHVYGEHEFPVSPLLLPDEDDGGRLEQLERYEAISLFLDRARSVQPHFCLDRSNIQAVAGICRRLDGLPLAIELAAAQIKYLSPGSLLERLTYRLSVAAGDARHLPARHRTLRAAIDWSYSLSTPDQQRLFARLSVFRGGCTLETAQVVCSSEDGRDVFDDIKALVDQSLLLTRLTNEQESRFVMLETIREYAAEKLHASGKKGEIERRHAEYLCAFAESVRLEMQGPKQMQWLQYLRAELDNLRAVMDWACNAGEAAFGLRLVNALTAFWKYARLYVEIFRRAEDLLATGTCADARVRAEALTAAGALAYIVGATERVYPVLEQGLAEARALGDKPLIANACLVFAEVAAELADLERALPLAQESRSLFQELGDTWRLATASSVLAGCEVLLGHLECAEALLEANLTLFRQARNEIAINNTLRGLAKVARLQGHLARAKALALEALLAMQHLTHGEGTFGFVSDAADFALDEGDALLATRLLGAQDAANESIGVLPTSHVDPETLEFIQRGRDALGEVEWDRALMEGRALSLEAALVLAREYVTRDHRTITRPARAAGS